MMTPHPTTSIFFKTPTSAQERLWCEEHQSLLCHRFVADILNREPTQEDMLAGLYIQLGRGNTFSPFVHGGRKYPLCFVYGDDILIWGFFRDANRQIICDTINGKVSNCSDESFRRYIADHLPRPPAKL